MTRRATDPVVAVRLWLAYTLSARLADAWPLTAPSLRLTLARGFVGAAHRWRQETERVPALRSTLPGLVAAATPLDVAPELAAEGPRHRLFDALTGYLAVLVGSDAPPIAHLVTCPATATPEAVDVERVTFAEPIAQTFLVAWDAVAGWQVAGIGGGPLPAPDHAA